jgi:predicted GTPase
MKVSYKDCSNLTVYDTPGFRKGLEDPLGQKIQNIVLNLIKPTNRVIVCLEQSTVEFCNTQVRPIIQQVDQNFKRTILITTKFNNRINQFKDTKETEEYIYKSSKEISPNMFFISLPR